MPSDSTVLLVSTGDLPAALVSELEAAGLFVETTSADDFSQVFTVVSPDLVVHWGAEQAEALAIQVAAGPDPKRVRLVLVVERDAVQAIRQTNRSSVASVLSNDMPQKTLVERVVLLAQKSSHQAAQSRQPSTASPALGKSPGVKPLPSLSSSLIPRPQSSLAPQIPRATVSKSLPPTVGLPPLPAAPPVAPPLAAPVALPAAPPVAASVALPAAPPVAAPVAPPARVPAPLQLDAAVVQRPAPAERSPLAPVKPSSTSLPRLVLVDDDVARGDALAVGLRALGYAVQLSPSDPARTRWTVLRKFAPDIIVTDGNAAPQLVWIELLRADAHLRSAELITAPYRRLFEDASGAITLDPLLRRLEGTISSSNSRPLAPAADAAAPSTDAPTSHEYEVSDVALEDEDRPTLVADDNRATLILEEETRKLHLAAPLTNAVTPLASPVAAEPVAPPLPASPSAAGSLTADSTSAAGVALSPPPPARQRSRALPVTLGLGAILAGVGSYMYVEALGPFAGLRASQPAQATRTEQPQAQRPAPTQAAADSATRPQLSDVAPAASAAAGAAPASPGASADALWVATDNRDTADCAVLVPEQSDLRQGDVAQSSLFWDKARSALVLGDTKTAQAHLCRAVLVYAQSLAVEALAEGYLNQHAPSLAKTWIERALVTRPGRPRSLDLLGDIESQLGHVEAARQAWTRALQISETDTKTLEAVAKQQVGEGNQALRANNLARAELVLRRAATLNPGSVEAAEALAQVFLAQKDESRAKLWGEEAKRRAAL